MAREISELGVGARLRGVEAVVDGSVAELDGELFLLIAGTGESLRLAPLREKVQWDREAKRPRPPALSERDACRRLRAQRRRQLRPVRVTGPLAGPGHDGRLILEVREFVWKR